jgi:hypothetical protein
MAGRPENLKPKTSAKARGKLGGIKSGIVKRERKKLSEFYAEALAREYEIETTPAIIRDGKIIKPAKKKKLKGQQLVDHVFGNMFGRCDMVTAKLLENIGDFTEGKKLQTETTLNINTDDKKVSDILARHGVSKSKD